MKGVICKNNYSVVMPNNSEYEMIKQVNPGNVNKTISYLKWKRNKNRAKELNISYEEVANNLKIW
jgi:hypothetical protein